MLRDLMQILLVLFCLTWCFSSSIAHSNNRDKGPPPPEEKSPLFLACNSDIETFCPKENKIGLIMCLEMNMKSLSPNCQKYLGTTVYGGCNHDVETFCHSISNAAEIINCLKDHQDNITTTCLNNLSNRDQNQFSEVILEYKRATRAISLMSFFYLLAPLIAGIWGFWKIRVAQRAEKEVLLKYQGLEDEKLDYLSQSGSELYSCSLIVRNISYFSSTSESKSRSLILDDITCRFPENSLSAIMGPSGSGKTTLLRILAGQMSDGEIKGSRFVNGLEIPGPSFHKIVRSQGYVPQYDCLFNELSVWDNVMFASLLRISDDVGIHDKLSRAFETLKLLGLDKIAHNRIREISGGQKRRLSIALELLRQPRILFLDEPTSGLDASSSLQIISFLHSIAHEQKMTIILSIHQPRSEAFNIFDNLLLLGVGGKLMYFGPPSIASDFLTRIHEISLKIDDYENPGDFILDAIGLDQDERTNNRNSPSIPFVQRASRIIDNVSASLKKISVSPRSNTESSLEMMPMKESEGSDYSPSARRDRLNSIERKVAPEDDELLSSHNPLLSYPQPPPYARGNDDHRSETDDHFDDCEIGNGASKSSQISSNERSRIISDKFFASTEFQDSLVSIEQEILMAASGSSTRSTVSDRLPSVLGNDMDSWSIQRDPAIDWMILRSLTCPCSPMTQIWILFWRRWKCIWPTPSQIFWLLTQLVVVTAVVVKCFSYEVSSSLEAPYQILMIFLVVSTYGMIFQYLILIPEYMNERLIIHSETSSNTISMWTYIMSAMLTEVPRAVALCLLLIEMIYWIHPMNPDPIFRFFSKVSFMVGVCAWQSLIVLCSMLSDDPARVYSFVFLMLGSGTLFGGILIRLSKIPKIFRPIYFLSVTALTQRALIENDMECCYLSATCNTIYSELHQHASKNVSLNGASSWMIDNNNENYCPPGLEFTGDGSDEGNLGRLYLKIMGLDQDRPFTSLLLLFWANIIFRALAIAVMYAREKRRWKVATSSSTKS